MKLHTAGASPFGRKVQILAIEAGLGPRVEIVAETISPVAANATVAAANPLGKIPVLVTDEGVAVYDSRVICEHLDTLHDGPRLFPAEPAQRLRALTLQALADGIMDAAVGTRYETALRPEPQRWPAWIAQQKQKVARALDRLEAEAAGFGERLDIGTIAVGCALGYLDHRFAEDRWRDGRPALAAWFARFAQRPSFASTTPT
jgi:glutathione S-transferase